MVSWFTLGAACSSLQKSVSRNFAEKNHVANFCDLALDLCTTQIYMRI
jgi:hypothetical protein